MRRSVQATLSLPTPEAFEPLLGPERYKGAFGGRGSGKSHFYAERLMERAMSEEGFRAVCIREVQKSLQQSVKQLIEDKIRQHQVGAYFDIKNDLIRTATDGLIIFQGMQNHTADSIKSLEGFDVAYVEEAHSLSDFSLRLLRPTIRKPGSQLWFAWNPRHDTDAVDKFFRGQKAPDNSVCVNVSWRDNPWLPAELYAEMKHDFDVDPEMAEHVWEGGYEIITEGSYYARLIRLAEQEGRVASFPWVEDIPVSTSWDIGIDDYTAIWYFQEQMVKGRPQIRVIDYYETHNVGSDVIAQEAIHGKPYTYEFHFLPHDVKVREWAAGGRSRFDSLRADGVWPVRVGKRQSVDHRVNAVRVMLPYCVFDANANVHAGLKRLRNYKRKWSETLGVYQGPDKTGGNDHGADAFGEYAINCPLISEQEKLPRRRKLDYARASTQTTERPGIWL